MKKQFLLMISTVSFLYGAASKDSFKLHISNDLKVDVPLTITRRSVSSAYYPCKKVLEGPRAKKKFKGTCKKTRILAGEKKVPYEGERGMGPHLKNDTADILFYKDRSEKPIATRKAVKSGKLLKITYSKAGKKALNSKEGFVLSKENIKISTTRFFKK